MAADLRRNSHLVIECNGSGFVIKRYSLDSQQKIDKLLLRLYLQEKGANSIFDTLWQANIQSIQQFKNLRLEDIRKLKLNFSELDKLIASDESHKSPDFDLHEYHVIAVKDLGKEEKRLLKIRNIIRGHRKLLFRRIAVNFGQSWVEIGHERGLPLRQTVISVVGSLKLLYGCASNYDVQIGEEKGNRDKTGRLAAPGRPAA